MSIDSQARQQIEDLAPHLLRLSDSEVDRLVDTGDILKQPAFRSELSGAFGQFYAPFGWINDEADIVIIGITPGRQQASASLRAVREALQKGASADEAAKVAKESASFKGDMRSTAAKLMNRFAFDRLFGLTDAGEVFSSASRRAHYMSLLRWPVLHRKKQKGVARWSDFGGGAEAFSDLMLLRSIAEYFEPEILRFPNAWLVPFGDVPAEGLRRMVAKGLVDPQKVLAGLNHPAGHQWNRHNCQLNTSDDHSACAPNVGCVGVRARSRALEQRVASHLGTSAKWT